jgi:hypothetical protein
MSFLVTHRLLLVPEVPLSTIVRDVERGYGGDSKTTSYNCFCHSSSSSYCSDLGSYKVEKACAADDAGLWRCSTVRLGGICCHVGDGLVVGMSDPWASRCAVCWMILVSGLFCIIAGIISGIIFHLSSFIFHLSSFIFHLSSLIAHLSSLASSTLASSASPSVYPDVSAASGSMTTSSSALASP